jgi:hypothetical protein
MRLLSALDLKPFRVRVFLLGLPKENCDHKFKLQAPSLTAAVTKVLESVLDSSGRVAGQQPVTAAIFVDWLDRNER